MSRTDRHRPYAWLAAVALGLRAAAGVAADAPASHLGVASCASGVCHGAAKPLAATAVQQNEYVTWSHFDPHARAYASLRTPGALAMARRLGLGLPAREPQCLACHAEDAPAPARGPRFQPDDGVGCEACHGASAKWIASHDDASAGRRADNLAQGLRPIERALPRAQLCAACHVGSPDRLAGHALMAAGHPRLVFELDTYSELWRTSGGREHFVRDADYARRKQESPSVNIWLAGLTESAGRLLALAADERVAQGVLPEFALFNCHSCHRSMRLRRFRDLPGVTPGSPRVADSSLVMLAIALDAIDPGRAAKLRESMAGLQRAIGRGMPALHESAGALRPGILALQSELAGRAFGPEERKRLLASVLDAAERGEFPDYSAAEQAAMAVTMLLAETGAAGTSDPQAEALFADLRDDERFDPERFRRILARVRRPAP